MFTRKDIRILGLNQSTLEWCNVPIEKQKMVRFSRMLLKEVGIGINKTLSEMVCLQSKQPLRLSEKTNSLISDSIGVSYPIVDGIPCLVPMDGKIIETDEASNTNGAVDSSELKNDQEKR